jgi:hypothetical protein
MTSEAASSTVYEHATVSLEGRLDPTAPDLAAAFLEEHRQLANQVDQIVATGLPGGGGWGLVSHDVLLIGDRTLVTLIFRRLAPSDCYR